MTARKHLVEMLEHLVNENEEKARMAFHNFVVKSARQIHESVLADDDLEEDINELEENQVEEYYGEEDMTSDADEEMVDMPSDEAEDDLEDNGMADADVDLDVGDAEGEELEVEKDDVADVLDAMEELTAKFKALMGDEAEEAEDDIEDEMGGMEVDMEIEPEMPEANDDVAEEGFVAEEEMDSEDELEEAVSHDGGVVSAKHGVDPHGKHGSKESIKANTDAKLPESQLDDAAFDFDLTEEDFQELEEGLKAIDVKMGGEQGGNKFAGEETQTKSPVAKRDMSDVKSGSKDMVSKKDDHAGYDREEAPSSKSLPHSGDNSKNKADEGRNKVESKVGGEQGSGKFAGTEVNVKSPIGSQGTREGR